MIAQIVLTTAESKKLIAKAVVQIPFVRKALNEGVVVIHPSSTTSFIFEEITGSKPEGAWVFGLVAPGGLYRSKEAVAQIEQSNVAEGNPVVRKQWVFEKGILQSSEKLDDILSKMTEKDVFIKGCNALDSDGNVAVLSSSPKTGGTSGKVCKAKEKIGFHWLVPVGVEKLIPSSIIKVNEYMGTDKADSGMGLKCGLFPIPGEKIDECDALKILFEINAIVAGCGGLAGAEGSTILYVRDSEERIMSVLGFVEELLGTKLPDIHLHKVGNPSSL